MNVINQLIARITKAWNSASLAGRVLVGVSLGVTLVTMIGVSIWSSTPDYKLLRDHISPSMTAEIVSACQAAGIPTKLNYSGTGVMVPAGKWNEANVAIASISSSQESGGDVSHSLMPHRPSHDASIRAREFALEKSLAGLQVIRSADVHLAIPKRSAFLNRRQPPSASVIVEAENGHTISREVAQGIVHTVAAAIEGLDPENVTLTDSGGQLMGGGKTDPAATRREYVAELESELALKAQDHLTAVLGPNRSVVRVTARVDDFLDKVTTKDEINTANKARITEKLTSTDQKGVSSSAIGTAGTASNNGNQQPTILGGNQPVSGKTEMTETEYDYPRTTETLREIGGQVIRLSISATVDNSSPTAGTDPQAAAAPSLTKEQVEGIVKSAVGFDATRGDQLEVTMIAFASTDAVALDVSIPEAEKWQYISQLAKNLSLGLAALAALVVAVLVLKKIQPIEIKSSGSNTDREVILSSLSSRIEENPEALSKLLAAWVNSEEGAEATRKAA